MRKVRDSLRAILLALLLVASGLTVTVASGCKEEGTAEKAGRKIDEAAQKAQEKAEDAGEELEEAAKEMNE